MNTKHAAMRVALAKLQADTTARLVLTCTHFFRPASQHEAISEDESEDGESDGEEGGESEKEDMVLIATTPPPLVAPALPVAMSPPVAPPLPVALSPPVAPSLSVALSPPVAPPPPPLVAPPLLPVLLPLRVAPLPPVAPLRPVAPLPRPSWSTAAALSSAAGRARMLSVCPQLPVGINRPAKLAGIAPMRGGAMRGAALQAAAERQAHIGL